MSTLCLTRSLASHTLPDYRPIVTDTLSLLASALVQMRQLHEAEQVGDRGVDEAAA